MKHICTPNRAWSNDQRAASREWGAGGGDAFISSVSITATKPGNGHLGNIIDQDGTVDGNYVVERARFLERARGTTHLALHCSSYH